MLLNTWNHTTKQKTFSSFPLRSWHCRPSAQSASEARPDAHVQNTPKHRKPHRVQQRAAHAALQQLSQGGESFFFFLRDFIFKKTLFEKLQQLSEGGESVFFFLRDFIFKKTLFEKLQY